MQGICRRNLVTKEGYHIVEELQTVDLNAPNTYPSRLPKYIACGISVQHVHLVPPWANPLMMFRAAEHPLPDGHPCQPVLKGRFSQ